MSSVIVLDILISFLKEVKGFHADCVSPGLEGLHEICAREDFREAFLAYKLFFCFSVLLKEILLL